MGHAQKVCIGIDSVIMLGYLLHYEMADTTTIKVINIPMSVIALGLQREKECLFRKT
jgi:hypothetical protein